MRARGCAQKEDNARARVCVRVMERNALLARCSGLYGVLGRCPTDNPPDPLKRLKTAYRALEKKSKKMQKSLDKARALVYNAVDGEREHRRAGRLRTLWRRGADKQLSIVH